MEDPESHAKYFNNLHLGGQVAKDRILYKQILQLNKQPLKYIQIIKLCINGYLFDIDKEMIKKKNSNNKLIKWKSDF